MGGGSEGGVVRQPARQFAVEKPTVSEEDKEDELTYHVKKVLTHQNNMQIMHLKIDFFFPPSSL